jgi:hypothetical protein
VHGPIQEEWDLFLLQTFDAATAISLGVEESGVTKLYNFFKTFYEASDRPDPFVEEVPGGLVSSDQWPCFEKLDRTLYFEFWRDGSPIFRKQHTSTPDLIDNTIFHSYSFISPAEALGDIDEVVFFGGDSSSISYGSGVELYRSAFVRTKTGLESYQLNALYINGDV